ncbi:hypothetical protein HpHA137_14200 [Helicobacter pylori]
MANESIKGEAYNLSHIVATKFWFLLPNSDLPTPLPMDRKKLRKAFRRFVF